jgi:hypothetical protein
MFPILTKYVIRSLYDGKASWSWPQILIASREDDPEDPEERGNIYVWLFYVVSSGYRIEPRDK